MPDASLRFGPFARTVRGGATNTALEEDVERVRRECEAAGYAGVVIRTETHVLITATREPRA